MSNSKNRTWRYQPGERELIAPGVVVLEDDGACGDPECCGPRTYWIELDEKDGKLIAAAPDLFRACVAHMMARKYEADPDSMFGSSAIDVLETFGYVKGGKLRPASFAGELTREAIKKAEGRSA